MVTNLCTGFIPVKEKCKVNYNLDEKLKLTKRKQESNNNKILFLKHKANKSNINLKKENDFIQKVFKYDNNRKKIHKIKKENDNANIDTNNEKINKLKKKLRDMKKEKEQKLGGNYTDDTTIRPFIDIQ